MTSRYFKIFRFSPVQFLRYQFQQKSSFWVNWYETWYWNKQKYRWLHLQCKQLANGVSNCLEPLLIFPWVMNIHIAHCVYTLYMLECKIWKTARVSLCGYDRQAKYCKTDWRGIPIIQISKKGKAGWWSMTFTSWVRL